MDTDNCNFAWGKSNLMRLKKTAIKDKFIDVECVAFTDLINKGFCLFSTKEVPALLKQ